MRQRSVLSAAMLAAAVAADPVPYYVVEESPSSTSSVPACTATSSTGSGAFFDLRPDTAMVPEEGKSTSKTGIMEDYYARGYDYGKNFTMNICGAVIEPVTDVAGVSSSLWKNISAYYTEEGQVYSIGSESLNLTSRGRKLVLQYTGGSPCGPEASNYNRRDVAPVSTDDVTSWPNEDTSALSSMMAIDEEDKTRRKSTTISFLCDREPSSTQASIAFVGTDPDECAYFFEVRSSHACAHAEPHKPGSVGPGSIFGIILLVAVAVYALGGVFYNRTVTHARGWRQIPNYSFWAGMWSFICDMFVIALSSCSRLLPGRRGYSHLSQSPSGRNNDPEAENRLIDQLDEEWDD